MTAPIKTCDYCGATGEMPTFMNGETICYTCMSVLPKTLPEARQELMRLRAVLAVGAQPAPSVPREAIGKMLADVMAVAVSNGANSVSMPDEYVEIAVWLQGECPAQPAPSVPDGWLRAIDEALVTAHIGVANAEDTYEQAKAKLDSLIGWHTDVATDPAVNGGYRLIPIEPTEDMLRAMTDPFVAINGDNRKAFEIAYTAMLEAAPEAKP